MTRPRAVAIDLFGTLVHIDPNRFPTVEWDGRPRLSSAPVLLECVRSRVPELDAQRFVAASIAVQDELEVERRIEHREIPSIERFRRTLARVGIDPDADGGELLREVQRLHVDTLNRAAQMPALSLFVLAELARRLPVVLVSNFDDGAACRRLLAERGIAGYLTAAVISEEVGWRKPHRLIFQIAAQKVGCPPEEIVFVGDSPIDDIEGARAAGMHPVWIRGASPPPPEWEPPECVITDLVELLDPDCLGKGAFDAVDPLEHP